MSFFDVIFINSISVLFPFLVYSLYIAYSNLNNHKENENHVFNMALLSSIYLLIKLSSNSFSNYSIVFLNIPLLFSYIKNKRSFSVLLSAFLIIYFVVFLNCNTYLIIAEYICYYIANIIIRTSNNKDIKIIKYFTLIKSFFFSLSMYHLNQISNIYGLFSTVFITMIVFYICCIVYYYLLKNAENIVSLNSVIKSLEREKALKDSLFKLTHEIKNPIAVCKGYLDMLDLKDYDSSNRYINTIKNEIERTLVLMDDFLDYSKIKVEKDIMDISFFLEETLDEMKIIFIKNDIELDVDIIDDEIFINGDYNRLKQVFVNILKNCIEAKKPRKKLKISIKTEMYNNEIKITVSDNGIGMTKEELNSLGEAFYTTKNKGTGLGVLLSKDIISLHGGELLYCSEKGIGTDVIITLPLSQI